MNCKKNYRYDARLENLREDMVEPEYIVAQIVL